MSSSRKIYIVELPKCEKFIKNEIRTYFEGFGKIRLINIQASEYLHYNSCEIEFMNEESAKAAVRKNCHHVTHQNVPMKIFIKSMNCKALTDLNEYCLAEIFKQNDVLGQIRLSRCNKLLETVYTKYICHKISETFDIQLFKKMVRLPKEDIEQYWRHYGSYCKRIDMGLRLKPPSFGVILHSTDNTMESDKVAQNHCDVSVSILFEAMHKYCTNLQQVSLQKIPRNQFVKIFNANNMKTITELELSGCDLLDCDLEHLIGMPNLMVLILSHNKKITGEPITRMIQLKSLSLSGCDEVNRTTLVEICKSLNLRYLNVLSEHFRNLNEIVEYCEELVELRCSFSFDSDIENIAKLPNLKALMIYQYYEIPDSFYHLLAEHHSDDLEALRLFRWTTGIPPIIPNSIRHFQKLRILWLFNYDFESSFFKGNSCYNLKNLEQIFLDSWKPITDNQILTLLQKCRKLESLDIMDSCWTLTENGGKRIIALLKRRAEESAITKPPFLLTIHNKGVSRELKNLIYLNAPKLVRVTYRSFL